MLSACVARDGVAISAGGADGRSSTNMTVWMRPRHTNLAGRPARSQTSTGSPRITAIPPLPGNAPRGRRLTAQGKTGRFTCFEHTFVRGQDQDLMTGNGAV